LQTSQGYIIRILQHFATKLWNVTNFVMLFQAVMKFLSRLVEFKILVNWGMVHWINDFFLLCFHPGFLPSLNLKLTLRGRSKKSRNNNNLNSVEKYHKIKVHSFFTFRRCHNQLRFHRIDAFNSKCTRRNQFNTTIVTSQSNVYCDLSTEVQNAHKMCWL
jgi:hypothetical protein